MGLSRTVSDINGDFSRKSHISPCPCIFNAPMKGFLLELGAGVWGQKLEYDGATGSIKKFDDIFSHLDTIHKRVRQTDRR